MPIHVQKRQPLSFRPLSNKRMPFEPALPSKTSLWDSLPVELQVEIFFQCLSPYPTFSIDEAPLTIARVCRAWKYLVFNTPKLWSAFEVKIEDPVSSMSQAPVGSTHSKVKQWLLRSKQCPLSIRLTNNRASRFCDSQFTTLLTLLGSEAHRWRHVEFTVSSAGFSAIQRILTDNLPAFQSFALRLIGPSRKIPSLDLSLRHLPWRQITLINILPQDPNLINLDGCLDILAQTERLKECTIKLNCAMDLLNVHQNHCGGAALPVLDKLTLYLHAGGVRTQVENPQACLAQFLNILSVPQLQTLHLGWFGSQYEGSDSTIHDPHDQLLSFFNSIAETLRSLTIAYLPFTGTKLHQYLFYLNNLTHLVLKYPLSDVYDDPITSSFLSSCTFPKVFPMISLDDAPEAKDTRTLSSTSKSQAILLPILQHCEIEGHGRGYTGADLIAFIESRSKDSDSDTQLRVSKIKSCRIFSTNIFYDVDDEMKDYVRIWKDKGMHISIESLVIR